MSKEWILNLATNRWGLNKKDRVGPVAKWIREVEPKTEEEWERAYLQKLAEFLAEKGIPLEPEAYLRELGSQLYIKICEVVRQEIDKVTEEDCVRYIRNLVIRRTFEGYTRERETVYGQLQAELQDLGVALEPCPEEVDRHYHVDFWIVLPKGRVGIQIKPITYMQQSDVHRWLEWMDQAHRRFTERYGGRVFVVFSRRGERGHEIANPEVLDNLRHEIRRLQGT